MDDLATTLAFSAVIAVGLGVLLRQWDINPALPLLAAGAIVGQLPFGPSAPPDPNIVLIAVLAPLVFGEALGFSFLDLRRVRGPVIALSIGLVVLTTLAIGFTVAAVVAIPLFLTLALGAVLAPTDAVAVSFAAKRAGLPRRIVAILEGEGFLNDATGLTALSVTLTAAALGTFTFGEISSTFVTAIVVGVLVGALGGAGLAWVLRRTRDGIAANTLVIAAPFSIYLLAEEWGGSGFLAVVAAALIIAGRQHADPTHTGRLHTARLWGHITFALQSIAFFLIGIELPTVLLNTMQSDRSRLLLLVPLVLIVLIGTRIAFVLGMLVVTRGRRAKAEGRGALVIAWAGAKGPVSGLGAFSIPMVFATGMVVPDRDLIIAVTMTVIVASLLLSLTLAPVARALGVTADDDEETLASVNAHLASAAMKTLDDLVRQPDLSGAPMCPEVAGRLRSELALRDDENNRPGGVPMTPELQSTQYRLASLALVRAEQEALIEFRDREGLSDSLVRPILRKLDERAEALRSL